MSHYFSDTPDTPLRECTHIIHCCDETLLITTASSVFAKKGLDQGSRLLIRAALTTMTGREKTALDLGCGTGILGILLKKKHPHLDVWMSDVNPRAVRLARKNCEQNSVHCTVLRQDGLTGLGKRFDLIITNPPYHAGRRTVLRLLKEAWEHLSSGGRLLWVGRHQKGGKTIQDLLHKKGIPCETLERESGYRVYICPREDASP